MGGSSSKHEIDEKAQSFLDGIRSNLNDEIARRGMIQREVQLAVSLAQTRDMIQIFGSAWAILTLGAATAKALGKPVPGVVGVPILVGGFLLGNMADLAYGNKMARVIKEAEYMMEHERGRFVPFKQAPFHKFYTREEKDALYVPATAVGNLFPSNLWAHSVPMPKPLPPPDDASDK